MAIFPYAISFLYVGTSVSSYRALIIPCLNCSIFLAALDKQSDQEYVSWQNEQLKVGKEWNY
jgi:hypothetical protein